MSHFDPAAGRIPEAPGTLLLFVGRFAHVTLVVAAAFAVVAVPLAMAGWFHGWLLFPLVAAIATALLIADPQLPFALKAETAPTVAMLVAVIAAGILSFAHPTQHFATNRDPGIYATTGLWLEREGSILFDGRSPEFEAAGNVSSRGAGFYAVRADGRLDPQFAHLTHTLLGAAATIGGEPLLTRANVVVGVATGILLFLLTQQFAHGWAAAATTAAFVFALPQMYFTRGPYSEPLAQLIILGGLAVLVSGRPQRPVHSLLAGLLLGAAMGSRIDAVLLLSALVIVGSALAFEEGARSRGTLLWTSVGIAITGTIGILDLRLFASGYFADLWPQFRSALLLALLLAVLGAALVLARDRLRSVGARVIPYRRRLAVVAGAAAGTAALALLFVRPLFPSHGDGHLVTRVQERQGLLTDPPRSFTEQSAEWLAWYLGWPLMIAAALGAAVVAHRLTTRWSWPLFSALVALGLPTAVYLYRPSITIDHLWVMRRFLPTALPLMALLAAIGVSWLLATWSADRVHYRLAALGTAAVVVLGAMSASYPYWTFREFRLDSAGLREMCSIIDGRPVLLDNGRLVGATLTQPIAAACGVDVGRTGPDDLVETAERAAREYHASGEELIVLSGRPEGEPESPVLEHVGSSAYRIQQVARSVNRPPIGTEQPIGSTVELHYYTVVVP